jgi:short-subunit dehydrogenase
VACILCDDVSDCLTRSPLLLPNPQVKPRYADQIAAASQEKLILEVLLPRSVVAITGASSGIGAAFARRLAADQDLLLIARRKDRLAHLADELSSHYGAQCSIFQADLTDDADLEKTAERIAQEERLALLINNAGFGLKGRFWESALEPLEQMHKLHVLATVRLTHAALRNMVPRDFGAIINVASVAGWIRTPGSVSYSATKTWTNAFTEGLYLELKSAHSSVAVQALSPGFTYSEFHDSMGVSRTRLAGPAFWLTAEEVVDASLEGLRRRKLFVVPGWRYKLITAFLSAIPTKARLAIEEATGKKRLEA